MRIASIILGVLVSVAASQVHAQSPVEEVLVTGEHPGPGLWKVWNGDHVLWILGTHSPLPQGLVWRSQDVELVMTEAQQVIGKYSASFTLQGGSLTSLTGQPLGKVLPRKSYRQWQALKKKYIGRNNDIEKVLPVTAALVLRSSAFEQAGFDSSEQVWDEIQKLAHAYNVPVTTNHQVEKVLRGDLLKESQAQRVGVDFLIETMANLDSNLRTARASANAWAAGDIEALRKQAQADRNYADLYARSWPFLGAEELAALSAETDKRWVDAADGALRRNRTTFAALPIFLLLRPDGVLSALRAKGFEVEEPH